MAGELSDLNCGEEQVVCPGCHCILEPIFVCDRICYPLYAECQFSEKPLLGEEIDPDCLPIHYGGRRTPPSRAEVVFVIILTVCLFTALSMMGAKP